MIPFLNESNKTQSLLRSLVNGVSAKMLYSSYIHKRHGNSRDRRVYRYTPNYHLIMSRINTAWVSPHVPWAVYRGLNIATHTRALTSALLDEVGDGLGFIVGHLEDVAEAVQHHLHHLRVFDRQQVTEGRNHLLLDQVRHLQDETRTHTWTPGSSHSHTHTRVRRAAHLVLSAADGQVADGPRRLLLSAEISLWETHQWHNEPLHFNQW